MAQLFGTDGIRGRANSYPMDTALALAVGRAVAVHFKSAQSDPRIVIGQDTRISGDMLVHALAAGICAAGVNVELLGVLPTPGIAYMTRKTGAVAGIVISASHNPYEDNGIKVFTGKGLKLNDKGQDAIEELMDHPPGDDPIDGDGEVGRSVLNPAAGSAYLAFLAQSVPGLKLKGLTLALDCANGATYQCGPQLFKQLGAKVIELFCNPDGKNINAGCGSQHPDGLAAAVLDHHADLGLAFDGDGDRLIAVDDTGTILSGDQIMAICARDLLGKGKLRHNAVVSTIMSNLGFHQALKQMGLHLHTTQVGDRHVMEEMIAKDAVLGGEDSGHIIFRDVHTTGDGMLAGLRLVDAVQSAGQPLSQLRSIMSVYPQVMINVDVKEKPDLTEIPGLTQAIHTAETELGDQGRILVRYSGTQNQCRVMAEGPADHLVRSLCQSIADVIEREIG